MKTQAKLTFDRVLFSQNTEAHLVVSLTAPALTGDSKRPPICIVPVIDVSPSMEWGQKLEYAKRSVLKLVDHLQETDYCGLVQFSMSAEVLVKPTKVTQKVRDSIKRQVGELRIGNATNLSDALLVGLAAANKMDLPPEVIVRVILFTDGAATAGVTDDKAILSLLDKALASSACNVSVSAFGYGDDAKQEFLSETAKRAKGNYAYIKDPDGALSAFGRELGGLISSYANDVQVRIRPLTSHTITKVISDVDVKEEADGEIIIRVPEILAEETRNLVVAVTLAGQKQAFPREVNAFDVSFSYDVIGENAHKERKTDELKAKVRFVKAGEVQKSAHEDLDHIVGLAQLVRAQIEAEEKARKGDYHAAMAHMKTAARELNTRGRVGLSGLAGNIGDRLGSADLYASSSGYLTSLSRGATRGTGVASYDASAEADLHAVGVVTTNSSMLNTSTAFVGQGDLDAVQAAVAAAAADPDFSVFKGMFSPNAGVSLGPVNGTVNAMLLGAHSVVPVPDPALALPPVVVPAIHTSDKLPSPVENTGLSQTKSQRW